MWNQWRPVFQWRTLCPVLFADPIGLLVVMARAAQPVTSAEVRALPDYYPNISAETKPEDYGRLGEEIVAVDYGIFSEDTLLEQRRYYQQHTHRPATVVPRNGA